MPPKVSKNVEAVMGFRKLEENKTCFICHDKGPQNVEVNHAVFVCNPCAGIQRGFNHRIKTISMADFKDEEVEAIKNGGNAVGRKLYLANWSPEQYPVPQPGDTEKLKKFIAMIFEEKRWMEDPKKKKKTKPKKESDDDSDHEDRAAASSTKTKKTCRNITTS